MTSRPSTKPSLRIEVFYKWGFILILGLGLALRLTGLGKSIWLDEYITIKIISGQNLITQLKALDVEPPLYFALLKAWSSLGMQSDYLRLLSVLFGFAALAVFMLWLKLYSRLASLLGGLLFATLPVLLRFSQELRAYPLLLLGTVLSFFFASRIGPIPDQKAGGNQAGATNINSRMDVKPIYYWGLGISLVISVLSHMTGVMVVVSVGFFICAQAGFNFHKLAIKKLLIVFSAPALVFCYIFFFFLHVDPSSAKGVWAYPPVSLSLLVSSAQTLLGRTGMSYGYSLLAAKTGTLYGLLPWIIKIIVIILVVIFLMAGKWRQTWCFLAAALFYEMALILYSILFLPILFSQTLLPMLIPAIGFVGLQISSIRIRVFQRIAASGIIILCIIFAAFWFNVQAYIPAEPWQAVASFIKNNASQADMVIYYPPYNAGPAGYYLDGSAPAGRLLINFVAPGEPGPHMPFGDDSQQISISDKALLVHSIDLFASQRENPTSAYKIFLVVREEDPYVLGYALPYKNLVDELETETGSIPLYKNFDGLSVRIFKVSKK